MEDPLPVIIADDLLEDEHTPVAPTLQILLTKMWDAAKKGNGSPIRKFSIKQYQDLRRDGLLMADFFKQQMEKLGAWQRNVIDSGLVLDLLKFHTTRSGTSRTRHIDQVCRAYPHAQDIIDEVVNRLKHLYLLTDTQHNGKETSLAHSTLAPVVIKEYNNSDKPGQRATRVLTGKVEDFKRNRNNIWLDEGDLEIVQQGKPGMRKLDKDEEELLEISKKRKEQREQRDKRRRLTWAALIVLIIMMAAVVVWQRQVASNKEKRATITTANKLAFQAQSKVGIDPTAALRLAEKARQLDKNPITSAAIYKIFWENNFYEILARQNQAITAVALSSKNKYILTRWVYH